MKRFLFFTVCCLFFFVIHLQSASAGIYPYAELGPRLSHDIIEILKRHGMPVQHDREIPWYSISGIPEKYTMYFSQADEIPLAAKVETIKYLMELYDERGRSEQYRLLMYKETKEEEREKNGIFFKKIKPFFEMTIGGNK